ncbi:transketolase [Clostridia bacterium]|nr:transketolase [Clostridia bacterium]
MQAEQKNILKYIANEVRKHIIEGTFNAKSGHPGGSLSIAEVITYLYMCKIRIDKNNFDNPNRDRFVLSKGHCVPAVYGILAEMGIFPKEDIKTLRQIGSKLQGHPSINFPCIDMASGSLGQGFSSAVGMAIAGKLDNKQYNVYAVLGDGELQEGIVWEAAMLASHRNLDNLIIIVDNNGLQIDGPIDKVCSPYPIDEKFKAFGWNVLTCDGHDFDELEKIFSEIDKFSEQNFEDKTNQNYSNSTKPTVVIIKTVKGKDVSFMENNVDWHGAAPNKEQYDIAMSDLNLISENLEKHKDLSQKAQEFATKISYNLKETVNINNSTSGKLVQFDLQITDKPKATRESYGESLRDFAEFYPDLVVLDADLSAATKTNIFKKKYPERHINCGIAEQNLMGVAAGLAAAGKIPFASSFAMFATGRAYEIIRNSIGYTKLNVKIGATHAGISVGEDGASHQCNEDIALMRTIPNMVIINPCDDIETKLAVRVALDYNGAVYMRFGRFASAQINKPDYKFELGKGVTLKDGDDITIISTGLMVKQALLASEILSKKGVNARVINIHTIKPLDTTLIKKAASETKKLVTVEEHSIIGGLGSAVIEAISENPVPVKRIGINDVYGYSGNAADLLKAFGLTSESIVNTVLDFAGNT